MEVQIDYLEVAKNLYQKRYRLNGIDYNTMVHYIEAVHRNSIEKDELFYSALMQAMPNGHTDSIGNFYTKEGEVISSKPYLKIADKSKGEIPSYYEVIYREVLAYCALKMQKELNELNPTELCQLLYDSCTFADGQHFSNCISKKIPEKTELMQYISEKTNGFSLDELKYLIDEIRKFSFELKFGLPEHVIASEHTGRGKDYQPYIYKSISEAKTPNMFNHPNDIQHKSLNITFSEDDTLIERVEVIKASTENMKFKNGLNVLLDFSDIAENKYKELIKEKNNVFTSPYLSPCLIDIHTYLTKNNHLITPVDNWLAWFGYNNNKKPMNWNSSLTMLANVIKKICGSENVPVTKKAFNISKVASPDKVDKFNNSEVGIAIESKIQKIN